MNDEPITKQLPPEKLLSSPVPLIQAGIECMDNIETIQEYVAYENAHQQRVGILNQLRLRAQEVRRAETESQKERSDPRPCL